MNLVFALITLTSVAIVHGQQGEKGTSIIPFPRVGRSGTNEARFFMEGKRAGNSMTPGLIPFPRVGRGGSDGMHEVKRQLIPFPRVGKRPYWHSDPVAYEYEDLFYAPAVDSQVMGTSLSESVTNSGDEIETEKRNNNNNGGMWFGPRLGKRKKRSVEADSSIEASRDSLDESTLLKVLHNFKWAIVPVKSTA